MLAGLCLAAIATPPSKAEQGLARLQALQKKLSSIPVGGKPSAQLLAAYKNDIVYSEPSGRWLVCASLFWKLRDTWSNDPAAERIAWAAACQPLPGECETDAYCHLALVKMTDGRYLQLYPAGKHATEALSRMSQALGYLANDTQGVYDYAQEPEYTKEGRASVDYLRSVVTASTPASKTQVLQQIEKVSARIP